MLSLRSAIIASFIVLIIASYFSILLNLICNGGSKYLLLDSILLFIIIIRLPFVIPFWINDKRKECIENYLYSLRLNKRKRSVALRRLMKSKKLLFHFLAYNIKYFYVNFDNMMQEIFTEMANKELETSKIKAYKSRMKCRKNKKSLNSRKVIRPMLTWEHIIKKDLLGHNNLKVIGNFY